MDKLIALDIGNTFYRRSADFGANDLGVIGSSVSIFLKISFSIAGLILLFYFIMGGIGMISSAGQDNPQKAEQAKKTITSAVVGFVVVLAAYWIVKLLGQLLNIPNLI